MIYIKKIAAWVFAGINKTGLSYFYAVLKISTILSIPFTFIDIVVREVSRWYIVNKQYVVYMLLIVALDFIFGSYVHFFKHRDFSWYENFLGVFTKILIIIASYLIMDGLNVYMGNDAPFFSEFFITVLRLSIFLYPTYPLIKNIDLVSNGKSPFHFLIKIIENFRKDGDLKHFVTTKSKEPDSFQNFDNYEK